MFSSTFRTYVVQTTNNILTINERIFFTDISTFSSDTNIFEAIFENLASNICAQHLMMYIFYHSHIQQAPKSMNLCSSIHTFHRFKITSAKSWISLLKEENERKKGYAVQHFFWRKLHFIEVYTQKHGYKKIMKVENFEISWYLSQSYSGSRKIMSCIRVVSSWMYIHTYFSATCIKNTFRKK